MTHTIDLLRKSSTLLILVMIVALFAIGSPAFLTVNNLLTVALQSSIIALVAIGMTFTIITGGIDLSVGSVAALCGALGAIFAAKLHLGTYPGIGLALIVGALLGAISGLMIVRGRIPPFVATLAMMAVARGLTLVFTEGRPVAGLDAQFTFWGSGDVGGVPLPVIVVGVIAVIMYLVLTQTTFGLHLYAVGGGEETARLAGVPSARVKFFAYVLSAMLAALAGVLLAARLWSAQPNAGVGLELDAIAAAVLGGTSLAGGIGGIGGTVAGALIIGVLSNGLNLLEVPSYNQQVIKGLVFIFAVVLDYLVKRRWAARQTPTA